MAGYVLRCSQYCCKADYSKQDYEMILINYCCECINKLKYFKSFSVTCPISNISSILILFGWTVYLYIDNIITKVKDVVFYAYIFYFIINLLFIFLIHNFFNLLFVS